ncbi:FITM1 protein, partial [Buphagus erythrorhynchus]|nr:FITM1 protein [Buphagus erythrorhynchus]
PVGHFARPGGHLESPRGHFVTSQRRPGGGHLGEAPPLALSVLYLLALALLLTWHLLLVVTLTYRNTWARNAAGAALGWAAWAVTYRGWYRRPWSPGPPGWG